MLTVNADDRPTAMDCYNHQWFKDVSSGSVTNVAIDPDVMNNLRKFQGHSTLRRACLTILVKMINPKEFLKLRDQFNSIDTNLSGTIEAAELKAAIKQSDSKLTDAEID